jgi:hypothetical protein
MTPDELRARISRGEDPHTDFKQAIDRNDEQPLPWLTRRATRHRGGHRDPPHRPAPARERRP